jgi:GNAT superfamily N-acetyltransferase
MTPADVDAVVAAFLRDDDWGDRRLYLEFVTRHAGTRPIVAEVDGGIVGTGVLSVNGGVGWIGVIWVDPAWRGRGVGMALTQATIDAAESAGCRTLLLVATEAGRRLYEKIGFEVQTWYRILEAPGLGDVPVDPRIRPFTSGDLPALAELSAAATGEDRTHLLTAFASPETALCLIHGDGTLGGFVVRAPWGGGSTIAPLLEDAEAILHARRAGRDGGHRVRAGLLAENRAGIERLLATGWTESWSAPRLIRGDALVWQPEAIWGQFNHALG